MPWPGAESRSTLSLMARTSGSPARWTSSNDERLVEFEGADRVGQGSLEGALWSSRLRSVPSASWVRTRVVLPDWRGPVTTVTRRAATVWR